MNHYNPNSYQEEVSKQKIYRHRKRGTFYYIVDFGKDQDDQNVVIYRGIADRRYWVRPVMEFFDGRFEEVKL